MAKSSKDKPVKKAAPKDAEEKAEKSVSQIEKATRTTMMTIDDDEVDDLPVNLPRASHLPKAKKMTDDDDDDDDVDVEDDWEKVEEEEEWDPDFDEFDIPKSKTKKGATGSGTPKKGKAEDEDLGVDDDFKDMDLFNDSGFDDEDDDY